jgi:hypothetical protein
MCDAELRASVNTLTQKIRDFKNKKKANDQEPHE